MRRHAWWFGLALPSLLGCFDYGPGSGGGGGGGSTDAGPSPEAFVGVVAGADEGGAVSGTVRFTREPDDTLLGAFSLSVNGAAPTRHPFQSRPGVDAGLTADFSLTTSSGLGGALRLGPSDAGTFFAGTLRSADGGLSANVSGGTANSSTRAFCGTFSGAAAGTWNFVITSGALTGAYDGTSGALHIAGYLTGNSSGSSVELRWAELFASGTALGTITGSQVSGTWAGYADGGTWTSNETCPGF